MKIGIDGHTLGSQSSGNENYCLKLLRDLAKAETNADRFVIYFTYLSGLPKIPVTDRFKVKRILPANPFIRIPVSFPLEFRREKLDVFHAQYILPPWCNCRTINTIHDILFESHPEFYTRAQNLYFRALIPGSARRADHIITVSEFSKKDIVSRYRVDPDKVTVIEQDPRDEFRLMNPEYCREVILSKYGIAAPFILYVGRINPRKNLIRLVEAFSHLRRKGMQYRLVIVGKQDWMAEQVVQRVKELSLEDTVIFTGYIDWNDVALFYNAADLLVYPSICEGFGLPVMEAMACGVPVVTSFGSSLEEVAGGAAILVDPYSIDSIADALGAVIADRQLAVSLREKGLRRVADFRRDRKPQQTISIYHKVCGRN
jgi:glycosyltransferase involved in cell wall biosynthesis